MALFTRNDDLDLHDRIEALQKEVAVLSRSLSKHGKAAYRDASDHAGAFYGELSDRVSDAMPVIRRQARAIEDSVRENPTRAVAAVGLGALLITAAVLLSGSRR